MCTGAVTLASFCLQSSIFDVFFQLRDRLLGNVHRATGLERISLQ
jgi:hypothetical protein